MVFSDKVTGDPRDGVSEHRIEKRWLGCINIPFSTIYKNGRVEGTFSLDAPLHYLGYHKAEPLIRPRGSASRTAEPCMVTLCVTLDPPLIVTQAEDTEDKTLRDPDLNAHVQGFIRQLDRISVVQKRNVELIGWTVERSWVLVTRFIRPLEPPPDCTTKHQTARFVSLIPFMDDWVMGNVSGEDQADSQLMSLDIWCTCDEFLRILAGDWEEHAILLCNYLLHHGANAYVVTGRGIPEGDTVYVLTVEEEDVVLWNAALGVSFSVTDTNCTLKEIGMVFNGKNAWVNIQPLADLWRTSFKFDDPKCWKPLFGDKPRDFHPTEMMVGSIQEPLAPMYRETSPRLVSNLENDIETTILERFQSWRGHRVTHWHRQCNRTLKHLLRSMEEAKARGVPLSDAEAMPEDLVNITSSFRMNGFCINRPWTDIRPLLEAVYNSDIHNCGPIQEDDTFFSLAVHVHAYFNDVVSVWIYVASLVSIDRGHYSGRSRPPAGLGHGLLGLDSSVSSLGASASGPRRPQRRQFDLSQLDETPATQSRLGARSRLARSAMGTE